MRRLHPVFNVVKLTPSPADPIAGRHPTLLPPPKLVEGVKEYLVEEILDSKMFRSRLKFKIKWEGYGLEHDSWKYATEVHAPEWITEFYRKNPAAPRQIQAAIISQFLSILSLQSTSRRSSPKKGGRCKGTLLSTFLFPFHLQFTSTLPQVFLIE
jgi:hypothetical protein